MAVRDPETGQFVTGGNTGDDIVQEWWGGTPGYDGAQIGAQGEHVQYVQSLEPLDGLLDREQKAELLHLYINYWLNVEVDDANPDREIHAWYEIGSHNEMSVAGPLSADHLETNTAEFVENHDAATQYANTTQPQGRSLDPDIWWVAQPHASATADDVNGAAATSGMHMMHQHIDFRELPRAPPVLFHNDEVNEHTIIALPKANGITTYREARFLWRVTER